MSNNQNQKLKTLSVLKILMEQSDESHSLTVGDLIERLKLYDITAERKSIYADIELLKSFGIDIVCDKTRSNNYYIGSRDFELAELKLLVDAVQASKFITHKKSRELIKKIEKLTSVHEAKGLHRHVIVTDRVKTMNESIYYNVDAIHTAIQGNRMVCFKYFDYTVDKNLKPRRNGEVYCVSPYALTWADENYYLIAYHERYEELSHFRVDRMGEIEVSPKEKPHIEGLEDFNIAAYSKKVFNMFTGDAERVVLEFDNSLINVVIDRFGKDVRIFGKTGSHFRISVEVTASNTFFGWLLMLGKNVQIIEPRSLADSLKTYIKEILCRYEMTQATFDN